MVKFVVLNSIICVILQVKLHVSRRRELSLQNSNPLEMQENKKSDTNKGVGLFLIFIVQLSIIVTMQSLT